MIEKILYNSGVGRLPSIFFPSGKIKDGGSCSFATPICLKFCESSKANQKEKDIFKYITTADSLEVFHKILNELGEDKLLYWFASGDCPPKHKQRIASLIKALAERDIIQLGFTRNKKLWETLVDVSNCYIILTIEDKKEAEKISNDRIVAVPDYKEGKVNLYKNGFHYGGCGADWYEFEDIICENDCRECYEVSRGCFS